MNALSKAGFVLAISAMVYLSALLIVGGGPINLASWSLWFIIDFAVIASLVRAKKPYALMVAFTVGTAFITAIATLNFATGKTPFSWGNAETITVIAVVVALLVWKLTNDSVGVIVTTLAMVVAGVPTWIDAYQCPETQSVLFWTMSASACFLTYLGSEKKFVARFMPFCGATSNALILALSLRQFV